MQERIPLLRQHETIGELICREEPLRVTFEARLPRRTQGIGALPEHAISKVWLNSDRGELLLGTLLPEGEWWVLRKSLSRSTLRAQGMEQPSGGELRVQGEAPAETGQDGCNINNYVNNGYHNTESVIDHKRQDWMTDQNKEEHVAHNLNYVNNKTEKEEGQQFPATERPVPATESWKPLSTLEEPITDAQVRTALRGQREGWWRREGTRISVCLPWREGQAYPIPELFCFSRIHREGTKLRVLYTFSEKWWPVL